MFDQYARRFIGGQKSQVVGLRYFNVYGPGEAHKGPMASVIWQFHRQLAEGNEVRLFEGSGGYGPGEQLRDFIHVDDVASANLWFLEHGGTRGIFNLGTGQARSFNDVAKAVIAWHGRGSIRYVPFPPELAASYQSFTQADLTTLRLAGYADSFIGIEEGVRSYLDALKALGTLTVCVGGASAPIPNDPPAKRSSSSAPPGSATWSWPSRCSGCCARSDAAAIIDVVGPAWSVPLVARMPEVRRGIALPAGHGELALGRRRALGLELRAEGYARAIVMPRSFKSALVPFFARIPVRTGFRTEMRGLLLNDARALDRAVLDQTIKRFLALGLPAGATLPAPPQPSLRIEPVNRAALIAKFGLGARPAVAMMPGAAYGPAKQWPIGYFGELAKMLVARGNEIWVLGSAGERELGEQIRSAAGERGPQPVRGDIPDRCGRSPLRSPRCRHQRLRADARGGRRGHPRGRSLWLELSRIHAAADGSQDDPLPRSGMQPVLSAGMSAGAPQLPATACTGRCCRLACGRGFSPDSESRLKPLPLWIRSGWRGGLSPRRPPRCLRRNPG